MSVSKHRRNKNTRKRKRVFEKKDFASGDGMLTTVWGSGTWHMLHTISFNYPNDPTIEDKNHYRDFILSLQHILPCKYCRMNLKSNLKKLPLTIGDMKNRDSFSRYVYNLHELINKMLKKKSGLTFCDVRERYEHFRSRCTEDPTFKKIHLNKTKKSKKEKGCTEPLYGKKSRCIIKIVPQEEKGQSIQIDKKCVKQRNL